MLSTLVHSSHTHKLVWTLDCNGWRSLGHPNTLWGTSSDARQSFIQIKRYRGSKTPCKTTANLGWTKSQTLSVCSFLLLLTGEFLKIFTAFLPKAHLSIKGGDLHSVLGHMSLHLTLPRLYHCCAETTQIIPAILLVLSGAWPLMKGKKGATNDAKEQDYSIYLWSIKCTYTILRKKHYIGTPLTYFI